MWSLVVDADAGRAIRIASVDDRLGVEMDMTTSARAAASAKHARADADWAVVGLDDASPVPETDERVLTVGDGQQGLEPRSTASERQFPWASSTADRASCRECSSSFRPSKRAKKA